MRDETLTELDQGTHTQVYSSLSRRSSERNYESKSLLAVIPPVCPLINRRIITCGPHQTSCERATPLNFRVVDINRFMPFHQSARVVLSALDTCISPIKRSSPPIRRSLIRSSCAYTRVLREMRTIYETRVSASRIANYIESSEPLFCSPLSADKAKERETQSEENFDSIARRQQRC